MTFDNLHSNQSNKSFSAKTETAPHYQTADKSIAKELIQLSRGNRKEPTETEALVWKALRNKNLGEKFRRQHAIGKYIVDFICLEKRLIIEIDGGYHKTKEQIELDDERTLELEQKYLFKVIRFTNEEVLKDINALIATIKSVLAGR